ncbi:hypothetical protein L7F22_035915 [Adiantum nelumboides]|nr:hypothetical protein [Adiantum nelumboides]
MAEIISHEANQPLSGVGISSTRNVVQEDWGHLLEFANSLLQEYAEHNQSKAVDIPEEDVLEVSMDTPRVLQLLAAFYEKAAIFFFTGRLPPMHFIRNWLNSLLQSDVVDEIFDVSRGFFEIMFKTSEARQLVLQKVPLFFEGQLVHAVPWRPLAEFQEILKQECPIWVEIQNCLAMYWPLLHDAMQSLRKVLVPPRARSNNRNKLCMLWSASRPCPPWLRLSKPGMRCMHFKLRWGAFAGHCFHCGQLGHFMAECKLHDKNPNQSMPAEVEPLVDKGTSSMVVEDVCHASNVQVSQSEDRGKQVVQEESTWKDVVTRRGKSVKFVQSSDQGEIQNLHNPHITYGHRAPSRQGDAPLRDCEPFVRGCGSPPPQYNLRPRSYLANEPSPLAFDKQGRVITPWDKKYRNGKGNSTNQPSSSSQSSSGALHDAFAVLGDYMGDVCAVLAAKERQGRPLACSN